MFVIGIAQRIEPGLSHPFNIQQWDVKLGLPSTTNIHAQACFHKEIQEPQTEKDSKESEKATGYGAMSNRQIKGETGSKFLQ